MVAISLDLNVTYSVFWSLVSFREAPWWVLVYYVWAIITNWRGSCATSICFTTYKFTLSYPYMSSLSYCEILLIRFICIYCTLSTKNTSFYYALLLIITELCLSQKIRINCFVIFCNIIFFCRQVLLRPPESLNCLHKTIIERRGYIRGQTIVVR